MNNVITPKFGDINIKFKEKKLSDCNHCQVEVDEALHIVRCSNCWVELDPVKVLIRIAIDEIVLHNSKRKLAQLETSIKILKKEEQLIKARIRNAKTKVKNNEQKKITQ